jgi:predicted AlkP superfamily phosphohydrolase/phosphomutase
MGRKVVLIGLDGVPCSLLREYAQRGLMPRMAEMLREGQLRPIRSSIPEVSSVAWASFMTGLGAAQHGIFGFMELDPLSYEYVFPDFTWLKAPPFWQEADVEAVVFNLPQTYPARPLRGVMVSGFVALELQRAVYPPRLYPLLRQMGYRLDVQSHLAREQPEAFFKDLFLTLRHRLQALWHLFYHEPWQLFVAAITETDRLHHYFYRSALGGRHYWAFQELYGILDEFLGAMMEAALRQDAVLITCSDHGFCPIRAEVYLNHFLARRGLFSPNGSEGLRAMDGASRAFCLEPSRVYVHLRGRYARGSQGEAEYEALRQELKESFEALSLEGQKVLRRVYLKEEVFQGPWAEEAPDLYLLPQEGFALRASTSASEVFGRSLMQGAHTYEDAHVFVAGAELPPGLGSIADLKGLVLSLLV